MAARSRTSKKANLPASKRARIQESNKQRTSKKAQQDSIGSNATKKKDSNFERAGLKNVQENGKRKKPNKANNT